ncbi:MAG: response regulator transcription factor [Leptospiraceae bacterium]|nr:response regulator transcription factor [Leptospiraceae bacterium]MCB1317933.1 response regulator transcription factor [Leptospiraceae bacterium]
MKARILLVEDDASLGEALCERLEKEGYRILWSQNIARARVEIKEFRPDLIVFDVRLPDGSGFDLAQELRDQSVGVPFIFLTAQAGAPERLRGFELGAEEFIPKPFHLKELLIRLEHVLSTHSHRVESRAMRYGDWLIDFDRFIVQYGNDEPVQLPRRDMALLHLLITNRDRAVSRDEILDRLWGEDRFPSNRTIDNSIVRLRQTFGNDGNTAIASVRGVGYRWTGDPLTEAGET